jgi:hypothetical protein
VLDDVTAALKDADMQRTLRDLIYNRRPYRLSIMHVVGRVQQYAPLQIRKTLSSFLMYKPRHKKRPPPSSRNT